MSKRKERSLAAIAALALALIIVVYYVDSQDSGNSNLAAESSESQDPATNQSASFNAAGFISEVESWDAVQGVAVSDNERSIWIGVMDNGNRRDGYAMSVCEAVREYSQGDVGNKTITILDGPKMSVLNERVELGKHRCKL